MRRLLRAIDLATFPDPNSPVARVDVGVILAGHDTAPRFGGLAQIPALLAALPDGADWRSATREHLALTHRHSNVQRAADGLARMLESATL